MSKQTVNETLITAQIDGTALNTSVAATSIIPAAAVYTLPANFFEIGKKLRVRVSGRISNIVTTPGTLTLDVRLGAVIAFTTQAIQLNATAKTNATWMAEFDLTCRSIGAGTTAALMGMGKVSSESVSAAATGAETVLCPATAPAVGTGFDSTTALAVNFFAKFSVSDAANSIQVHDYELIACN